MSSPSFIEMSSKRWSSARVSATPSSTFSLTVLFGSSCGSCGRMATFVPGAGPALVAVPLDRLVRTELRLLRQIADLEPGRRPRLAEEFLVDARHDPEQ